jgi:hypothetical protein
MGGAPVPYFAPQNSHGHPIEFFRNLYLCACPQKCSGVGPNLRYGRPECRGLRFLFACIRTFRLWAPTLSSVFACKLTEARCCIYVSHCFRRLWTTGARPPEEEQSTQQTVMIIFQLDTWICGCFSFSYSTLKRFMLEQTKKKASMPGLFLVKNL